MSPWHSRAAALAASLTLLAGCTGDTTATAEQTGPSEQGAVPAELQGSWLGRLTRRQISQDLRAAGFGEYVRAYLVGEEAQQGHVFVLTLTDDAFSLAYHEPGPVWHVGWKGALGYDDGRVTFDDDLSETVDTYTASRDGNTLMLTFASTTGQQVLDGIPTEAYSHALFSRPLTGVDCTPADLDACL